MLNFKFIFRQLLYSRVQALIFVACVILSIVTLVAINGFSISVNRALFNDARTLHGGDIIIRSSKEFAAPLIEGIDRLEKEGRLKSSRVYEFYSMVGAVQNERSTLARLKIVQAEYPFYGKCELASGRELHSVLIPGRVVVQPGLLERLNLKIGDTLRVGGTIMQIADVLLKEPDRPLNLSVFGPRVLIAAADLDRLDLVKKGSRVRFGVLVKVADGQSLDQLAAVLRTVADPDYDRVDTFLTARSGIKRFLKNFIFFLSLIGIFTMILAGIGINSALKAFVRDAVPTIAVMKILGATSRWIIGHVVFSLAFLGLIGTSVGIGAGFVAQMVLPRFFSGLVQENIRPVITGQVLIEGYLLGLLVVVLFTFLPLYGLKEIKPIVIFKQTVLPTRFDTMVALTLVVAAILFVGLVVWQLAEFRSGIYFTGAVLGLFLVIAGLTHGMLLLLRRLPLKNLVVRQSLKGLFRPRNATRSIVMTLAAALAVVFSIYLIEENLDAAFVQSYPPNAPNAFFLDIQPSQLDEFKILIGTQASYYPIIRARIVSVNGKKIDRQKQRTRRGDNLARTFNLTYRHSLLDDEQIIKGKQLFRSDWSDNQVSIMDTVAEMRSMQLGDRITFNIQGVQLEARISSIRRRTKESIAPFFYFVFQNKTLETAPQTIFSAQRLSKTRLAHLQNRIVHRFPNIRVIDMSETINTFAKVTRRMSDIVRAFTLISIAAGLLIIVSSIYATRIARMREAVYYKVLGARRRFVLKIFALENLMLGLISSALALLIAQVGSWLICRQVFDISYAPFWGDCLLGLAAAGAIVVVVGLVPSWPILHQKPVIFLRQQIEE